MSGRRKGKRPITIRLNSNSSEPIYVRLYAELRRKIVQGELSAGTCLPSERQLAKVCKVNRLTLRRSLELLEKEGLISRRHGSGTFVEDRERWSPSQFRYRLCVVHWGLESDYSKTIYAGAVACAAEIGMQVNTLHGALGSTRLPDAVRQDGYDAVLVFAVADIRRLDWLKDLDIPKLALEMPDRVADEDRVILDSCPGIHAAMRRMIKQGHRDFAYVGALIECKPDNGREPFRCVAPAHFDRLRSYRRTLEASEIPFRPERCYEIAFDAADARRLVERMAADSPLPTAIVAFDDLLADFLVEALKNAGINVPQDVSVLGFGNLTESARRGDLATVVVNWADMGRIAVHRLKERIIHGGVPGVTLTVGGTFKPGRSIGPPRHKFSGARSKVGRCGATRS